jgi:hypothetical protein
MRKPQEQAAGADGRSRRQQQAEAAGNSWLSDDGNVETKVPALTMDKTAESEI